MILKQDNSVLVDGNSSFDVSPSVFATALEMPLENAFTTSPRAIAIDYDTNRMFVTLANTVNVFNATTLGYISTITQVGGSFNNCWGLVIDNANNRLLVCNFGNSTVSVINLTTLVLSSVITTVGGSFSGTRSICFDANFYYILNGTSRNISVLKRSDFAFDATINGTGADFTSGNSILHMDIDIQAGAIFIPSTQIVIRLNTTTRATTLILSNGLEDYTSVCIDKVNDRIIVGGRVDNQVRVFRLSNSSLIFSFIFTGSSTNEAGVCVNYLNNSIMFCQRPLNKIEIIKFKN